MMIASWFSIYNGKVETLHLLKDPFKNGAGYYEDKNGNIWDIKAIIGKKYAKHPYVTARLVSLHPEYYSTSTFFPLDVIDTNSTPEYNINKWHPYYIEIAQK